MSAVKIAEATQAEHHIPPELLITILGPTASGKTELAVGLAEALSGEIISADSRQVYKNMDIGTGKDLPSYKDVPYHLINVLEAGQKYNVASFQQDFRKAYQEITTKGKRAILSGGTGMYIQSILQYKPYIQIPVNLSYRALLENRSQEDLLMRLKSAQLPEDYKADTSSRKRIIRSLEIASWFLNNKNFNFQRPEIFPYIVFGINPAVQIRRKRINERLQKRIDDGLLDEITKLLEGGLSHDDLQYYGLEYKYGSHYLLGHLDYTSFITKLSTEINRFAKRQMTYFRKMEKDGIQIHWLQNESIEARLKEIIYTVHENISSSA